PAIQDGQWHFLSITCLNNTDQYQSTIKLYIDGKLTDTMTTGLSIYTGNVTKFQFGGDGDGMRLLYSGYVTATNLKVDNIRIYDRELSAKDVKTIYDVEK
ncbi:MAG: LamG domain-containing protein, partial [Tannerella sp.]|nr:LamG domain-containing protein [Tannerella sp.]